MPNPIRDKRVLLGVTGSIAAYKAADLASKLTQSGARVDVILTRAARHFLTPLTFQSVTGRQAFIDDDLWGEKGHVLHVNLAHTADMLVIAPATADTLAKLAHGRAEDLLSLTAIAAECPLILAPAMDGGMYGHPATQANLATLRDRGAELVGPTEGHLASGQVGVGRMVEPETLLGHIRLALARKGPLENRAVAVTAGGTRESIDPVRTITNQSSGKQGYALARAALDLGARVTLISAPASLDIPVGAQLVEVVTAREMLAAVMEAIPDADALLMAAAVADFRPSDPAQAKIKKIDGVPQIALEPTPDILAEVARWKAETGSRMIAVGFAAESQDLLENAQTKLEGKGLDLIAANDISAVDAGFAVDTNRVTLLNADGEVEALPLMTKLEVAEEILRRVQALILERDG
jgi:phosphopantothenoylcysteine decarboxylase/phosphopantothenate--cysteine ligase